MKRLLIGAALLLAGCANDTYAVMPDGPGSQDRMQSALDACKRAALRHYSHQTDIGVIGGTVAGAPFGLIGGLIGGAVGGLIDAASGSMPTSGIDPAIERCMRANGYTGTSEN